MGMSRSLPPLNALRAFEAAGRHQSFSRAAEELGVSHSAVSRHVRGLEDRLGAQLFRTLSRGVVLTRAGERLLYEVTPAFDQIAAATEPLSQRPEGLLTVDAEPLFAANWLIPRLGAFYDQFPGIELRLEASRAVVDIDRYEADMAIRFYSSSAEGRAEPLVSDAPLRPYAAPGLVDGLLEEVADLGRFRFLRDRAEDTWSRWCAEADVVPVPGMHGGWRMRATMAIAAALAGHGVFLSSAEVVDAHVQAGRLVCCSDVGFRLGAYVLVTGPGVLRRAPARHFRDWVLDESAALRSIAQ